MKALDRRPIPRAGRPARTRGRRRRAPHLRRRPAAVGLRRLLRLVGRGLCRRGQDRRDYRRRRIVPSAPGRFEDTLRVEGRSACDPRRGEHRRGEHRRERSRAWSGNCTPRSFARSSRCKEQATARGLRTSSVRGGCSVPGTICGESPVVRLSAGVLVAGVTAEWWNRTVNEAARACRARGLSMPSTRPEHAAEEAPQQAAEQVNKEER